VKRKSTGEPAAAQAKKARAGRKVSPERSATPSKPTPQRKTATPQRKIAKPRRSPAKQLNSPPLKAARSVKSPQPRVAKKSSEVNGESRTPVSKGLSCAIS